MIHDRTVGVIGGGQLARMLNEAATPLGLRLALLAEGPDVSAARVVVDTTVGDYTDPGTVAAFARRCDVVTFDHEHVPAAILRDLVRAGVRVRPGPDALVHAQDKAEMRDRLTALGVPCPAYRVVDDAAGLTAAGSELGWPIMAKTSRGGYDGKGVWRLDRPDQASLPFGGLADGVRIVAEEYIPFTRELSALVVRRPGGEAVAYAVSESVQRDGICHETTTPAPGLDDARAAALQRLALRTAADLGVVGVLAVELMERPGGGVVVNELAMRPHNTGHWTIEGAVTSQFENHLRAVLDLPLGRTDPRAPVAVMSNVLGGTNHDLGGSLPVIFGRHPRAKVHLYGKQVRPGRKVGHVTVLGNDVEDVRREARAASGYLEGDRDG